MRKSNSSCLIFMQTGAPHVRKWRFILLQIPRLERPYRKSCLYKAVVTQNSTANQALLRQFNLIGPPAILFFGPDQQERNDYRVVGYLKADEFLEIINRVFNKSLF
jgi:thiol:disulfide interchange protein